MIFAFGAFELDSDRRELRCADAVLALEPKAFNVLVYLLTHRDRIVSKEECLQTCWPGEFVAESSLNRCLRLIRQAVGDDGARQHIIRTVRGYGYRFVATVQERDRATLGFASPATPLPEPLEGLPHPGPSSDGTMPRATLPEFLPPAARLSTAMPAAAVMLPCPQCHTPNRAARQFCAMCGHELWRPCLQCGFSNGPHERFCGGCGHDVTTVVPVAGGTRTGPPRVYTPAYLAHKIRTDRQALLGERKPVTVLVAGVQGLRELLQMGDPEEADAVMNRGFVLAVAEVHRVEGFVTQVTGDSFTALFGAPLAYEDHVVRALHAALELQRAFAAYAAELCQTHDVSLTLRLGVHTGPLVVSAISDDLRLFYTAPGVTFRLALGLQHFAQDGTIAVSEAVQQQAAGFFQFHDMGTQVFPDVVEPVRAYTCTGVAPVLSRLEAALARRYTPFHGRTQELALLEACWTRVCHGEGQVVCLVGEAGIGKSRLAYESQQHLRVAYRLTLQALSYGHAMPYHAFLPLLRTLLGVTATDAPAYQRQALRTRLAALAPALGAEAPLLAHLLGIPLETDTLPALTPEVQRRRVQHVCLQVLLLQAATVPLCLLVEDGHWLDPSSQELLDLLVASLARRRILLLCTARPGFRHAWTDQTYFHQVAIAPLSVAETDALIRDMLQPYDASVALKALIRERAGGNPFFVEECVRTLQEEALLVLRDNGYELAAEAHVILPTSIQGIVQTRLDQLPSAQKQILQVAAVIGPEITLPLLHALVEGEETLLRRHLTHLQAAEFLYETYTIPVLTYTFTHALVQEAAYQSLVRRARQQYHGHIAQVLEAQFPDTVAAQPEVMAQHYTAAGRLAQALPYWQRAGERATARSAYVEAIGHLNAGLEALAALPDTPERTPQELALHIALGAPLVATKGYAAPEVERVYARARTLCRQMGDIPQLFPVLRGLGLFYLVRADFQTAQELGEQLLTLARRQQDTGLLLEAHFTLGTPLFYLGDLAATRAHMEQGIAFYDPQQHRAHAVLYGQDTGAACLGFAAWVLGLMGYADQALQRAQEALVLAQELSHPYSLAWAFNFATIVHHLRREPRQTRERAEALIAMSSEHGFPFWMAAGQCFRGWALLQEGQMDEAIAQIRQGLDIWQATGAELAQSYLLSMLVEAYRQSGQHNEGVRVLDAALALADAHRERFWEGELHRLKGELLLQSGVQDLEPSSCTSHAAAAEASFRQALDLTRRQHAKTLELRAALSLSRLWQRQGRRDAARQLLAEVYGCFTEGLDTADLREARDLLDAFA